MASGDVGRKRRQKFNRASKACTTCRAKKLRCDGIQRFPGSCTQCRKVNKLCEMDVAYRPSKREATSGDSNSNRDLSDKSGTGTPEEFLEESDQYYFDFSFFHHDLDKVFPTQEQPIGDTGYTISGQTVWAMFRAFYQQYYPHLPIFTRDFLDPKKLMQNEDKRPLFWAICTVTSSHCAPELRVPLMKYTKSIIYESQKISRSTNITQCLTQILSLLVLCYWQPVHHSTKEDETWLHVGRATFLAMQLGLHQSNTALSDYYIYPINASEKRRTAISAMVWSACVVISQMAAGMVGLPCLAPINRRIYRVLAKVGEYQPSMIPFYEKLKLMHALRDAIDTLGNSSDTESGLVDPTSRGVVHSTVLNSFSHLATTIQTECRFTELVFLSGKILIHSFLLSPDTLAKDRLAVALPLSTVCIKTISLCHQTMDSNTVVHAIPVYFPRLCVFSALILFGLTVSEELSQEIDVNACRNAVSEAYQLFAKLTSEQTDLSSRAMTIIDGLQEMDTLGLLPQPVFHVQSRLGANGFFSLFLSFKRFQAQHGELMSPDRTINNLFDSVWDWDLQSLVNQPL